MCLMWMKQNFTVDYYFLWVGLTQSSWLCPLWSHEKGHNDFDIIQYRQTFNIRSTLLDNKIVDHSDVVGASPVGAAPPTSSFLT